MTLLQTKQVYNENISISINNLQTIVRAAVDQRLESLLTSYKGADAYRDHRVQIKL